MQNDKKLNILIVDDFYENIYLCKYYIREEGIPCSISEAQNGLEALASINENGLPHIILLDCQMPVMDGYEFLMAYKQLKVGKENTKVYVITSMNEDWVIDKFLATGLVAGFYEKPFSKELLDLILLNEKSEQAKA